MFTARRQCFSFGSLLVAAALLAACRGEYPLEPTECDDWCRYRVGCDADPAQCIVLCEETVSPEYFRCREADDQLLLCVAEEAPQVACGAATIDREFCEEEALALEACLRASAPPLQ